MSKNYDRTELAGNILKRVDIRFDYSNIFGISPEILREISKLAEAEGLIKIRYTFLDEEDYTLLDTVLPENSVPLEYLKQINSYIFKDEHDGIILEVNQLFCSITQHTKVSKYSHFENLYEKIHPIINLLKNELKIDIKRIGVKKIDEVFMESYEAFSQFFLPEILNFSQWDSCIAESKLRQSFIDENKNINLVRLLDRGIKGSKELFRLYLVYDVYSNDISYLNRDFRSCVNELNQLTFDLFKKSVTPNTLEYLKSGIEIGVV